MAAFRLDPDRVEVFYTELTPARAQVYARLAGLPGDTGCSLAGTIYGPLNRFSQSLPAKCLFRDLGPGPTTLARAVVPDPVFWTFETPALYRVRVDVVCAGSLVAQVERWLSFRGLSVHGRNLVRDGKRWVLRGATLAFGEVEWSRWRSAELACVVAEPLSAASYHSAAEHGVPLISLLHPEANLLRELSEQAQRPAVGIIGVPDAAELPPVQELRRAAPQLLLAQVLEPGESWQPRSWADVVLARLDDSRNSVPLLQDCPCPVLAWRSASAAVEPERARLLCDALQRELAPQKQLAGYIV